MKEILRTILIIVLTCPIAFAQKDVAMADTMRSEGKIYVVVAMLLIVLTGVFAYIFLLDRKVSRLEKRLTDKKS